MNHIKKSKANILPLVICVLAHVAVAIWQFFLFATFADSQGLGDPRGSGKTVETFSARFMDEGIKVTS